MKNSMRSRPFGATDPILSGASRPLRQWLFAFLMTLGLILSGPAQAQSYTGISRSPTTYSNAGDTTQVTVGFNTGNRVFSGLSSFDINGTQATAVSCTPSSTTSTGQNISCTGTYAVQSGEVGTDITLVVQLTFMAGSTPVGLTQTTTTLTYVPPAAPPTVSAVSPNAGPQTGGTAVVISGSNFSGATAVKFGSSSATSFTVNGANQITAVSPPGSGIADVVVTTGAGSSSVSSADRFTYIAAPAISSISPRSGSTTGGNSVVLTGTNLSSVTAITFGGTPATSYTINSASQITVTAPARTAGTIDIRVVSAGGTSPTGPADLYNYIATPTVTSVAPTSGTTSGGASVVITGTDFSTATAVSFGATAASSFVVNSQTQITAISPAHAAGTVDVRVTATGGTSATSAADEYTFGSAPVANSFTAGTVAFNNGANNPTQISLVSSVTGSPTSYAVGSSTTAQGGTVSVDNAGIARYTPAVGFSGNDSFTYTATNGVGTSAPATVTVMVSTPTITLSPASGSLPGGTVGVAYSQSFSASGGVAPYSYAVTAGALPNGMALSPGGTLSGPSTTAGTFNFTVTATDSSAVGSGPYTASNSYSLTIGQASQTISFANPGSQSYGTSPTLTSTASSGLPVSFTSSTTGVCTITSGGSLTFVGAGTCTINADQAGNANYNAASTVTQSFTVVPAGQTITFANPGTQTFGSSPTLVATASSGLPVTFTSSTGSVCTVTSSGTLTFVGIGTCTINADQAGNANYNAASTVSQSFTVATTPFVATASQANVTGTVGAPIVATPVTASGGQPPFSYALNAALPAGLSFATSNGTISGTPTAGLAPTVYTVTVTDGFGQTANADFTLTISAPTITVSPSSLPHATLNVPYSATISAGGGTAPYTYAVTAGALPAGVTLTSGGTLAGSPTATGTFNFTITATDSSTGTGPFMGSRAYALVVDLPPAPVIAPVPQQSTPGNTTNNVQSLDLVLNGFVSGQYSAIAIVNAPTHGTLTLTTGPTGSNGVATYTAHYTPTTGYSGLDNFTFSATGPGGTSAPATVTINVVGVQPSAIDKTTSASQSTPVTVDLTAGAVGGPFTAAHVVSVSPAGSLATSISAGPNGTFILTATPSPTFEGAAVVTYTLSNAFGTSDPSTVTITVAPRANPALDPTVNAISSAQAESARRFAQAQIANFQRRNEQLHHGGGAGVASTLSLNSRDDERLRQSELAFNVPGWTAPASPLDGPVFADVAQGGVSLAPPAPGTGERPIGSLALWAGGALTVGSTDGSAQHRGLDFTTDGLSTGVDIRLSNALTLGVGGGYGHDRTRIGDHDTARVRSDSWTVTGYGSLMATHTVFVDGVVGLGKLDSDTRRQTATGATALGRRSGDTVFASLSSGYDGVSGNTQLSLYGKLDWLRATLDRYTETGAGIESLAFDRHRVTSVGGGLGARVAWQLDGWRPHLRAEWRHEFKSLSEQRLDYADTGLYRYALGADRWSRNTVTGEVGADLILSRGWTSSVDIGGGLGGGTQFATGRIMLGLRF